MRLFGFGAPAARSPTIPEAPPQPPRPDRVVWFALQGPTGTISFGRSSDGTLCLRLEDGHTDMLGTIEPNGVRTALAELARLFPAALARESSDRPTHESNLEGHDGK